MSEELLKMYAELTQEVSLCQDEDIKALGKGVLELANNYDKSLKEIERLNNIITELEKWLKERLEKLDINGYDDDVFNGIELALYKLQELKGEEID